MPLGKNALGLKKKSWHLDKHFQESESFRYSTREEVSTQRVGWCKAPCGGGAVLFQQ